MYCLEILDLSSPNGLLKKGLNLYRHHFFSLQGIAQQHCAPRLLKLISIHRLNLEKCMTECKKVNFKSQDAAQALAGHGGVVWVNWTSPLDDIMSDE